MPNAGRNAVGNAERNAQRRNARTYVLTYTIYNSCKYCCLLTRVRAYGFLMSSRRSAAAKDTP